MQLPRALVFASLGQPSTLLPFLVHDREAPPPLIPTYDMIPTGAWKGSPTVCSALLLSCLLIFSAYIYFKPTRIKWLME